MPRSPSRDLSDRYTGKRGYFRNPDSLRKWKYALAWFALAAALAWAAVDVMKPPGAAYAHSHGPLANPHAAFDNNCAACHVAHSLADFGPLAVFETRARWHDLTCEKCHTGAPHHGSVTPENKEFHDRCSNCHHDHNGRLNSLVRISDDHCTRCHTDLGKTFDPSKSLANPPYQNKVTNFVTDHPTFRSLGIDAPPRTLTFSHAVHMNPGQAYSPDDKVAMTVEMIEKLGGKKAADRYAPGATDKKAKIQLTCASCHLLDAGRGSAEFDRLKAALDADGEPTKSLLPPRAEGAYYLPINFDVHCRSCHPLAATEGVQATDEVKLLLPRFDLPHRKQPDEIRALLKAGYVKELIASGNPALSEPPGPGGRLDPPPKGTPHALDQEADRLAGVAEQVLLNGADGCMKCHQKEPAGSTPTGPKFRIRAVPDRTVWFTHAKFNHAAHRGATCASCHPGTGAPPDGTVSRGEAAKPEPVQILGLETCRACHSPLGTKVTLDGATVSGGGTRHNCTDCHRYHHGDQPMQGRGGDSWFPKTPRDTADWLKGK
jgi:hypothetical protein